MQGKILVCFAVYFCAAANAAQAGAAISVPENRWTKVADCPPDPLERELEPGRGAFLAFDPASGTFLRYGGYTPTDCNALWTFDLSKRLWENPLEVDYTWPPPTNRPGAGAWWSMAYDSARKVIWLHGGEGLASRTNKELFQDIWQYDPAAKTFKAMRAKGYPIYGARIVYDSTNDLVIRAPAYDGEWAAMHNRDTTWVYDPKKNAWEGRKTPGSPKAALAAAFVFEPNLGKAVYLANDKDHLAATWTYDAAANKWERIETAERPPARVVAGAAYDAANKVVIICGGVGGAGTGYGYLYRGGGVQLTDTWALDLAKPEWKKLDVGAPVIPKLPGQVGTRFELMTAMDYDAKNKAFVLAAPTVGVWALRYRPEGAAALGELTLPELPPPVRREPPKLPIFPMAEPNKRLLELEPNTWVQLGGGAGLGGGEVPLIYDEATGFCLKFGGCNNGGNTFASGYGNDLSAFDPATERWIALRWVDPCGPPRPKNGCTRFYAYDPLRKMNWFAAGTAGNQLAASVLPGFEGKPAAWAYDGVRDRFVMHPTTGSVRFGTGVGCCFDRANGAFMVVPKEGWAGPNVCLLDSKTLAWRDTGAAVGFDAYTYGCFVDSLKSFVHIKPGKEQHQTLACDAAAGKWRNLEPKGDHPAGPGRPSLAYDPNTDVVLCAMGGRTYVLDVKANTWKALDPKTPAPGKDEFIITFDTRHKVFIGAGRIGSHAWAFRYAK